MPQKITPFAKTTSVLAALLLSACSAPVCSTPFTHLHLPKGYAWHSSQAPDTGDIVRYGIDPTNGRTIYVGPDDVFYSYKGHHILYAENLRNRWCPHDVNSDVHNITIDLSSLKTQAMTYLRSLAVHHDHLSTFNYARRPRGYGWVARTAEGNGATVYYGKDPTNGWNVFVGPDSIYYTFAHPGKIEPSDLPSMWDPHDISPVAPQASRSDTP
jgi:hypothetical protein